MVRIKNRWLLLSVSTCPPHSQSEASNPSFSLEPHPSLDAATLTKIIRNALALNFGDAGAGALGGLICKYYARTTGTAILRCSREGLQVVRATIFMIDEALGRKTRILVEHCGGTIKKVQNKAIQLDRLRINRIFRERKSAKKEANQKSVPSSSLPPTTSSSALDILASEDLGTSMDHSKEQNPVKSQAASVKEKTNSEKLDEEEQRLLEENRVGILSINP